MTDLNEAFSTPQPYSVAAPTTFSGSASFYTDPVVAETFAAETVKANHCARRYHYLMSKLAEIDDKIKPIHNKEDTINEFHRQLYNLTDAFKPVVSAILKDTEGVGVDTVDFTAFSDQIKDLFPKFTMFRLAWLKTKDARLSELSRERDRWANEIAVLRAFMLDAIRSLRKEPVTATPAAATTDDAAAPAAPDAPADAPAAPALDIQCAICFNHTIDTTIVPCGHCFCGACLERHTSGVRFRMLGNCPTCRQGIEKTQKLFF